MEDQSDLYERIYEDLEKLLENPRIKVTEGFPSLEKKYDLKEEQFTKFYDFLRMSIMNFPYRDFPVFEPFKKRHPETLTGKIKIESAFTSMKSRNGVFGTVFMLLIIYLLIGEVFILGGVCSLGFLPVVMFFWGKSKKDSINGNNKSQETTGI